MFDKPTLRKTVRKWRNLQRIGFFCYNKILSCKKEGYMYFLGE